ncbi:beta-1,3-galactosyltransferase 4 [Protopterus annectens]|uniref:beta-1,3-galactosyltransferase 4 n=1 Tax=Protopterus annectens TaxID=7888 RepID=UPI001CFAB829|nr:beta-1,3-galactosyltransferase 4 [Protopterus annectens]XP_043939460.1 beta-1,3-galactosyltransferase 4 [Protopterus annectens]XP_043939461.1 beta-1,3-galactosyltransferase 4 [Protopterus annectens]XP_043939462.1 beta-1,3-galactosyltransferase 4 [Protopterus annectens]XP_043939463.1 beta-1,3-galactosyltransferase 4 [Protopterus annectens]XP_043939464.1 beta-1,3-galactosyltransferase 4 [Protopterus annectens]XP_043939465.1 beta-1,3-galactosyltransferase 4 [Protopterus annectens]XP_04393946
MRFRRLVSLCRMLLCLLTLITGILLLFVIFIDGNLSPTGIVSNDREMKELRIKAANLDLGTLTLQASKHYRISNHSACESTDPFIVNFVISTPTSKHTREVIRRTWASVKRVGKYPVLTLFALGVPSNPDVLKALEKESKQYKDILLGNFVDTYYNLTLKTLMIMQWYITFCPHASFLLKVDEDVFVNTIAMVGYLASLGKNENLYMGRIHWHAKPFRDPKSKYFVSEADYPNDAYPTYCSGTAYLLSKDMARKIYVTALETPLFVFEDVYVGICAKKLGIHPKNSARMSGASRFYFDRCCYKTIFTSHQMSPEDLGRLWAAVNDGEDCSPLSSLFGNVKCKILSFFSISETKK